MPARLAMSSVEAPSNPRSANSTRAASRTSSRRAAAVDLVVAISMRAMLVMTHKLVKPTGAETRVLGGERERPCDSTRDSGWSRGLRASRADVTARRAHRRPRSTGFLDRSDGCRCFRGSRSRTSQRGRFRTRCPPALVDAARRRDGPRHRVHDHLLRPSHRRRGDGWDPDRRPARDGRRDRPLGLFRSEKIPLHWPRLVGIALLAAGAALSLRK